MKYILRGENDFNNSIDIILKNRNISMELFNLEESVIEDYNNYDNMQLAVETLIQHIGDKNKIAIVADPDVDGATSYSILYSGIRELFDYDNIVVLIHNSKEHGLSKDIIIPDDVKLIMCPDSSSNDFKQHKYYKDKGIDIIVLDHHVVNKFSENAIVVNNRLSTNVKNKEFSGAGVVYKFIKALDDYLFTDIADKFLDLVALGNVADVIDLKEYETRYLVKKGIDDIQNTFLKALIEEYSYDLDGKYNITKIGWSIAPKLNATMRSGTYELKQDMYKAFISDDYEFCLSIAKKCKSAKSSQDSAVKRALPKIEKLIELEKEDRCIMINVDGLLDNEYGGLVANKLQEKYGMPTILYRNYQNDKFGGSVRCNSNLSDDFKSDIFKSGLCTFAEGQPNAFGIGFIKENLIEIKQYINNLYKNKEIISGKTHLVDFILSEDEIDYHKLFEIAQFEDEWGNKLDEPLICFENINIFVDENNIKGSKSKNLVFDVNGVKFIKKFLTNVLKDELLGSSFITLNCIGKCTQNFYNDHCYLQIEIVDLEII